MSRGAREWGGPAKSQEKRRLPAGSVACTFAVLTNSCVSRSTALAASWGAFNRLAWCRSVDTTQATLTFASKLHRAQISNRRALPSSRGSRVRIPQPRPNKSALQPGTRGRARALADMVGRGVGKTRPSATDTRMRRSAPSGIRRGRGCDCFGSRRRAAGDIACRCNLA